MAACPGFLLDIPFKGVLHSSLPAFASLIIAESYYARL